MAIEKKFVNDGYVKASMNEYFAKQLNRAGYGGMELNRTPMGTQIIIYSEKPGMVIGKAGKVIRKLTRDVGSKYSIENPQIDAQEVKKPELNAQMMASRLAASIERGWYFRKAGHNTIRAIMSAGALGCEVIISGKLTGARSRVEKFVEGYIKHSGKPVDDVVDEGFAVAIKKLGTLGCKVRIIQPGVVLPDSYKIKDSEELTETAPKGGETPQEGAKKESSKKEGSSKELSKEKNLGKTKASKGSGEEREKKPKKAEGMESEASAPEVAKPEATESEIAEPEVADEEESEVEAEESESEMADEDEEAELIYVEGSDEVRRQVSGIWQHKHGSYDYWHPMARIHKEAKE